MSSAKVSRRLRHGSWLAALLSFGAFFYFDLNLEGTFAWGLSLAGLIGVSVLLYMLAFVSRYRLLGELSKGLLIGLVATLNFYVWQVITSSFLPGLLLAVLTIPSAYLPLSRNLSYQKMLFWLNWLLPMSWPVLLPGLLFLLINLIASGLGGIMGIKRLRTRVVYVGHACGWICYGGLIMPMRGYVGFNMGNFSFIFEGEETVLKHELGHALSLATFGWLFHYIGAIDENYIQKRPSDAYAELIADSHACGRGDCLSMWG